MFSGIKPVVAPKNTAIFSPCEKYRYWLTREELLGTSDKHGNRPLVVVALNPSTATAELDDPTIKKEMEFGRRWKCNRLVKANAYARRATDPKDMKRAAKSGVDIVGPENDLYLRQAAALVERDSGILLVAWGANITPERQLEIDQILGAGAIPMRCLGVNKDGSPVHPLYIPYERELQTWRHP